MTGRVHLRRVAVCDPTWQMTLRSSVIGFPLRAILGFNLFNIPIKERAIFGNLHRVSHFVTVTTVKQCVRTSSAALTSLNVGGCLIIFVLFYFVIHAGRWETFW